MEKPVSKKTPLAVCPTHGLSYDSALDSGCMLCRKQYAAVPAAKSGARHWPFVFALGLLAVAGVMVARKLSSVREAAADAQLEAAELARLTAATKAELEQPKVTPPPMAAPEVVDEIESRAAGKDSDADITSMWFAANHGSGRALRRMMAAGLDLNGNHKDVSAEGSILEVAIHYNQPALATWLVREGARAKHETAILEAAKYKMAAVVDKLLEHGANPTIESPGGINIMTPIEYAADNCDIETAETLVRHGVSIDTVGIYGDTLLHRVANSLDARCVHMAQWLIDRGANPKATGVRNEADLLPIRRAGYRAAPELVRLLVWNGADINPPIKESTSDTILGAVASNISPPAHGKAWQHEMIVEMIELGADVRDTARRMDGCRSCLEEPYTDEALIRERAKNPKYTSISDLVDEGGNTHLHWAAQLGWPSLIKRMLDRDLDVHKVGSAKGKYTPSFDAGAAPLHLAAAFGHAEAVELLLASGAKADVRDTKGRTPLDLVCSTRSPRYDPWELSSTRNMRCDRVRKALGAGSPPKR